MIEVPYNHPAWIEIDLEQFKKNLVILKEFIGPKVKLCMPVKANAYGHGLIPIAQAAVAAQVDCLGVSCLQEGALLRQANLKLPILVLGAIHSEQIAAFIQHDLEFTVASLFKAKLVAQECKLLKQKVKIHLEIDTGMNRTGMRIDTAAKVLEYIRTEPCFELKGVYSHLATADEQDNPFLMLQFKTFMQFIEEYNLLNDNQVICHLANSAGVAALPDTHLDMIRPGILAYGYHPFAQMPAGLNAIKPCFAIKAKVAYFKTVLAGQGVSYNHTYTAERNAHVLTIPVGYGDGLRRSLSNKGAVLLNGKRYPMIGNICMDQFMVDIGDDPGYVGDTVTIIGRSQQENIPIEEHSNLCSTITYEILCGFNNRLPRLYLSNAGPQWEKP
jgi:alanine racemase